MRSFRNTGCLLLSRGLLAFLLLGCTAHIPTSNEAPARGPLAIETAPTVHSPLSVARWQDVAQRLTAGLIDRGYHVQVGQHSFFRIDDCLAVPTCYGNNPSSPYGVYCLPPAPGHAPDGPPEPPCRTNGDQRWRWHLRHDEALVFVGQTPPTTRYFSFRTYMFSRHGLFGRRELFASLGDNLNLEVIAQAGTPNGMGGVTHLIRRPLSSARPIVALMPCCATCSPTVAPQKPSSTPM